MHRKEIESSVDGWFEVQLVTDAGAKSVVFDLSKHF